VNAKGEDFEPCKQFFSTFHSLCPNEWVCDAYLGTDAQIEKWDEQREKGAFPAKLE